MWLILFGVNTDLQVSMLHIIYIFSNEYNERFFHAFLYILSVLGLQHQILSC